MPISSLSTKNASSVTFRLVKQTAERLEGLDQKSYVTELAKEAARFQDEEDQKEFVDAVYQLRGAAEVTSSKMPGLPSFITVDTISVATLLIAFAFFFLEQEVSFLWSLVLGFVVFLLVRFLLRSFDRQFFFRRLTATWFFSGIPLFSLPTIAFLIKTDFAVFEWGGPPSGWLISGWILGAITLLIAAVLEAKKHGWS